MTILIPFAFIFVALLSFIGSLKNNQKILALSDLFLIVLVSGFFVLPYLPTNGDSSILWGFLMYLCVAILLTSISRLNVWLKLALGLLSTLIFLTIPGSLVNGEYIVTIADPKSLMLVSLGFVLPELANLKSRIINGLFKTDNVEMEKIILSALIGFSLFISYFFASSIGLLFTTAGFGFQSLLFGRNRGQLNALLLICSVFPLATLNGYDSIDLSLGKTLEGLFFGVFSAAFLDHISSSSKVLWRNVLALIISLLILYVLLFLGTQKSDLGGIDAYISAMLGIAVYFALKPDRSGWGSILTTLIIMTGIVVTPLSQVISDQDIVEKTGVQSMEKDENKLVKENDPFEVEGDPLENIKGIYMIDSENMEFEFELGPKGGRTKGVIKSLKGQVEITEKIKDSKFEIEIPVIELSTKNKFRDESLMGEEYFNVTKFPIMTFKSKKLVSESDLNILHGQFTMLGISKDVSVEVKYIMEENSSKTEPVLIGRGKIDRTLFGMKPDPKEGNVVDFNFKIRLKQRD